MGLFKAYTGSLHDSPVPCITASAMETDAHAARRAALFVRAARCMLRLLPSFLFAPPRGFDLAPGLANFGAQQKTGLSGDSWREGALRLDPLETFVYERGATSIGPLACCLVKAPLSETKEPDLKRALTTLALTAALALTHTAAQAEGCTKGAAVGGVTGHVAGDHAVAGAAAGCAIGHHEAKKKDKAASAAAAASQPAGK